VRGDFFSPAAANVSRNRYQEQEHVAAASTSSIGPSSAAIVAQQLIGQTEGVVDVKVGLRLVMESAIFMSKIDPRSVRQE
jgi:hypothetical protein